jgi:hypothetical protein
MAWDDSEFCGYDIVSGDKPLDQLSIALKKISLEYMERFERKPTVAEVLYAVKIVMISNGPDVFSDPQHIDDMIIKLGGDQGDA